MTVRWAVLGTANIARRSFLPALRAAGGRAVVVGSRSPKRALAWAVENEVERVAGYEAAITDPDVDAVYVPLPNDQHLPWTRAAVEAGKAVLCEKPFALDAASARETVAACGADANAWEAFVFPFHPQTEWLVRTIGAGTLGRVREVVSEFHFSLPRQQNIRWDAERAGGALNDVGCYPLRLARLLLGEPTRAAGLARTDGIDVASGGAVDFPDDARLSWSAGFDRPPSTFTRIVGTDGEVRLSNPFHPKPGDTAELWIGGELRERREPAAGTAFEHGIRHIHAVLTEHTDPRWRIGEDAIGQAGALDLLRAGLS